MTGTAVIAGVACVWLGMVLGISFLETPLRFRAPGVTTRIGLGIGRIVFRALNTVETVLAAAIILTAVTMTGVPSPVLVAVGVAVAVLVAQLGLIRPVLSRRSARVLAGETAPRSSAHLVYVAAESVKVAALITTGVLALSHLSG